jgi:small subunit ribosomal protein S24e
MELKIVEERANPLLKRTEYRFEIVHAEAATPTVEQVRGVLLQQLKLSKDRLVIESMHPKFGAPRTVGEAMAYQNAEALKAVVREHILIRNGLKEKSAAAAAPAAEAPAAPAAAPPAAEKPAAEKPAAEKPAAEKPAPQKPAAGKPTSEKSAAEKPASAEKKKEA